MWKLIKLKSDGFVGLILLTIDGLIVYLGLSFLQLVNFKRRLVITRCFIQLRLMPFHSSFHKPSQQMLNVINIKFMVCANRQFAQYSDIIRSTLSVKHLVTIFWPYLWISWYMHQFTLIFIGICKSISPNEVHSVSFMTTYHTKYQSYFNHHFPWVLKFTQIYLFSPHITLTFSFYTINFLIPIWVTL